MVEFSFVGTCHGHTNGWLGLDGCGLGVSWFEMRLRFCKWGGQGGKEHSQGDYAHVSQWYHHCGTARSLTGMFDCGLGWEAPS